MLTGFSFCDKVSYETQIGIKNETGFEVKVIITPINLRGHLYQATPNENGGFLEKSFSLTTGNERELFYGASPKKRPSEVFSANFESIEINVQDPAKTRIVISKDNQNNYAAGYFSDDNVWKYEEQSISRPTMYKKNAAVINNYSILLKLENVQLK